MVRMEKNTAHRFGRGVLIALIIVLLTSSGFLAVWNYQLRSNLKQATGHDGNQYPLLASRIFVDNPNDTILDFSPLRNELRQYFNTLPFDYSFYAEYLPTGTSIKISADKPMVGASLLKVPIVMNLFHAVEEKEIKLSEKVTIQESDVDNRSGMLWKRGVNYQLTLEELARYTIVDSDNTALNAMTRYASGKFNIFQQAIDELDVNLTAISNTATTIGSQGYSSILKCLYLSCLTTFENSQQILEWMSEANSPPRLRGSLPSDIKVAHKYGTSGGTSESDCGIVYIPKRPYIICIMLGTDIERANEIMQEVSKKMYDYVSTID